MVTNHSLELHLDRAVPIRLGLIAEDVVQVGSPTVHLAVVLDRTRVISSDGHVHDTAGEPEDLDRSFTPEPLEVGTPAVYAALIGSHTRMRVANVEFDDPIESLDSDRRVGSLTAFVTELVEVVVAPAFDRFVLEQSARVVPTPPRPLWRSRCRRSTDCRRRAAWCRLLPSTEPRRQELRTCAPGQSPPSSRLPDPQGWRRCRWRDSPNTLHRPLR